MSSLFTQTKKTHLYKQYHNPPSLFVTFLTCVPVCVCVCAETRTACPCEIYKARAATLSTQGENDLERKGVLYLDLPAAKLQVTLPKHRRGCCFQVLHKCYYTQCQSTLHKSQVPDIAIYPLPHPKPGWLKQPTKA